MGLEIRRYKNDKYGLYSTSVDRMIHKGKLTRDEAIEILVSREKARCEDEVEKIQKTFPNGYMEDKENRWVIIRDDRYMTEGQFYRFKLDQKANSQD